MAPVEAYRTSVGMYCNHSQSTMHVSLLPGPTLNPIPRVNGVHSCYLFIFACECARQLRTIIASPMADRGREILCVSLGISKAFTME
jgi:hypothetical protein